VRPMPDGLFATVITAFDEESVLERAASSVRELGEVHISVDRASTDGSARLARKLADEVYFHTGLPANPPTEDDPDSAKALNSYARMRNDVLAEVEERTNAAWLMWLDADEFVLHGADVLHPTLAQLPDDVQVVAIPMELYAANGQRLHLLRNSKIIRRGSRFVRRRHEHVVMTGAQFRCDEFALAHWPSQPNPVRMSHDLRKGQYEAFEADWKEFGDSRAAFYIANYWANGGHAQTALRWYEAGLALPAPLQAGLAPGQIETYAAKIYLAVGNPNRARNLLFKALEADWTCGPVMFYLGGIAANNGQFDEAKHWFELAQQWPEIPASVMETEMGFTRGMPLYGLASVAHKQGDRAEAYRLLRLAEAAMPCPEPRFAQLRQKLDEDETDGLLHGRADTRNAA